VCKTAVCYETMLRPKLCKQDEAGFPGRLRADDPLRLEDLLTPRDCSILAAGSLRDSTNGCGGTLSCGCSDSTGCATSRNVATQLAQPPGAIVPVSDGSAAC